MNKRHAATPTLTAVACLLLACDRMTTPTEPELNGLRRIAPIVTVADADWVVDDDRVQCPTANFTTIQEAIDAASNGQVIFVCAGVYPEAVPGKLDVYKSVTLAGVQNGVDARTRSGPESIIADPQGTTVSASNVVIDGFTIRNNVLAMSTPYGLWLTPGIGGTQILNNIIEDNPAGISVANTGAQAVIRRNWIRNNNVVKPDLPVGVGIWTDEVNGGAVVRNVLIEENLFTGHTGNGAAILIFNTNFAEGNGVFELQVRNNTFTANNRAILLFNTHQSTFDANTITGATQVGNADFRIADDNSDLMFTRNNLSNGVAHAISFIMDFALPSRNVEFHQNNIEVYALHGLNVAPGAHVGTVNAECNWWNSPTGPIAADNPGGTGEEVVGDADYRPWLIARAPGGACTGGLPPGEDPPGEDPPPPPPPPLEGKVTGGGQIPIGGSKATFGFNAKQRGGVGSGHLNYMNHVSRAHLDCEVKLITVLTPTTAKFEGTCNSKSSSAWFKAEVEDNSQSGKTDKFIITYSAGTEGGTLRSGNIQIHK